MRNLLVITITILIFSSACTKQEAVTPTELNYYPTGKDSKWVYATDSSSGGSMLSIQASGDILVDDRYYAVIGGSNPLYPSTLLVRKENGRYYGRGDSYGIYMPEFIFLQENLPVGSSWTNELGGGYKDIYTIISIDKKRIVGGKEYNNTIEVKTEHYFNDQLLLLFTKEHVYAEGIGIVSSTMNQSKVLLTDYEIK